MVSIQLKLSTIYRFPFIPTREKWPTLTNTFNKSRNLFITKKSQSIPFLNLIMATEKEKEN